MGRRYDTVSLLTDYGLDDEFVGVVKAVIRDLAPHVTTIDLTHGIRPFDVRAGSLALARAIPYVPEGIVLAVVDPGVGTSRRAIAVEVADGGGVLIGPDNGLLGPAVGVVDGASRAVELNNPAYHLGGSTGPEAASEMFRPEPAPETHGATFAGRDIFAPVAAHLCNGVDLAELGDAIDPGLLMPGLVPLPQIDSDGLHAEVLWVDRFGNCQLNIGPTELAELVALPSVVAVTIGDERHVARTVRTFGDLGTGAVGLVLDSQGMYALVLDQHSAAAELALTQGDAVRLSVIDNDQDAPDSGAVSTPVTLRPPR